jgi:hypothetical protein
MPAPGTATGNRYRLERASTPAASRTCLSAGSSRKSRPAHPAIHASTSAMFKVADDDLVDGKVRTRIRARGQMTSEHS